MRPQVEADRQLVHYLGVLGLEPGAGADEVAVAYYTLRRVLAESDSPEAELRLQQLDHAFGIVRARYRSRRREVVRKRVNQFLIASVIFLAALLTAYGVQVWDRLRPHLVSFDPGDAVFRVENHALYGVVLAYDPDHRFSTGARGGAYRIRLHPSGAEAWISARTARKAFIKR